MLYYMLFLPIAGHKFVAKICYTMQIETFLNMHAGDIMVEKWKKIGNFGLLFNSKKKA